MFDSTMPSLSGPGNLRNRDIPNARPRGDVQGQQVNVALVGRHSRRRHRIPRLVLWLCLPLTVTAIAGLPMYVRPQADQLRHADAMLILGGFGDPRYSFGLDLAAQGWAPNLVVSHPPGASDVWERNFCGTPRPRLDLHCFVPDPPTTKGEALELRRLASQYGWRTVIVVTFRPHISRARFILEHCFDGDVVMVASPAHIPLSRWAFEYVYQTAGYVRAALEPDC
jgi:hypothetical protein